MIEGTREMRVLRTVAKMREARCAFDGSVGFVPTMGALHDGHKSLIVEALKHNDHCVVSIFVNPTQFNDPQDLNKYPRPEERDIELCKMWGVSTVFLPQAAEMYADNYSFSVTEKVVSRALCGPFRPGHFEGVLTVVLKLFNIVQPTRAYFGEKDFQQFKLIQRMAEALHLPVEVVGLPTVREADGLALSSRNVRLTPQDRERAAWIPRVLRESGDPKSALLELRRLGFKVEYVEDMWNRRFAAVFAGDVRLIDNVEI